jgi:hypothetical protein
MKRDAPSARRSHFIWSSSDPFPRLSVVPPASKAPSQSQIPRLSSARVRRVAGFIISLINPLFPRSPPKVVPPPSNILLTPLHDTHFVTNWAVQCSAHPRPWSAGRSLIRGQLPARDNEAFV